MYRKSVWRIAALLSILILATVGRAADVSLSPQDLDSRIDQAIFRTIGVGAPDGCDVVGFFFFFFFFFCWLSRLARRVQARPLSHVSTIKARIGSLSAPAWRHFATHPPLRGAVLVEPAKLRALSAHARPVIGSPARSTNWRVPPHRLQATWQNVTGVPLERVYFAISQIPEQDDEWSCGVNSAARFASMLGQSIRTYQRFRDVAPRYHLLAWTVGGNPTKIQDYLRSQPELAGSDLSERRSTIFHPQWEIIIQAMRMGRPAMVLVVESGVSMHWINIIGRNNLSGNWYYLDTNRAVYEIPGGDDELKHRMNADLCLAQRCKFIDRFNSITCTAACVAKDAWALGLDPEFYFRKYPDLRRAFGGPPEVRIPQLMQHFEDHGLREGRQASSTVCYRSYLDRYGDLKAAFGNDCVRAAAHYQEHGRREGRDVGPMERAA